MAVPALRTLVFSFLIEGVVLTTDDLLVRADLAEDTVLPPAALPEDIPVEAWTRFAELLLFLLTVLLFPMPPLSDELLPNTLSEPVWCLDPYHTSLWWSTFPMCPGPWP